MTEIWLLYRCVVLSLTGFLGTYIVIKMHHLHRVGKNDIFSLKDHDHFGLGHKVQILSIKREALGGAIVFFFCLFFLSPSGFEHEGSPIRYAG